MERPWIEPKDVTEYSDLSDVSDRSEKKLEVDIKRAESYIMSYTNNDFRQYETVPEDVKVATILLAEYFAHNKQMVGKITSETFDDYSYTTSGLTIDVTALGLDTLLEPYMQAKASGKVTMRLRKL